MYLTSILEISFSAWDILIVIYELIVKNQCEQINKQENLPMWNINAETALILDINHKLTPKNISTFRKCFNMIL